MMTDLYFFSASLRPPIAFWTLPSTLSVWPSDCIFVSPTALPIATLTEPLASFAAPSIRSLFILLLLWRGRQARCSRQGWATASDRDSFGNYLASFRLINADPLK